MVNFTGKIKPASYWGYLSYAFLGIAVVMYVTQLFVGWFGADVLDRSLYSFVVLLFLLMGCASMYVNNHLSKIENPQFLFAKITFMSTIGCMIFIMCLNAAGMILDTNYNQTANASGGLFFGLPQLTYITQSDVDSLSNFAAGTAQLMRAFFLIVPFLIATWGGLSVLTADGISDAEGGILAIVAAFVVVIVVWLFKLVDVTLGNVGITAMIMNPNLFRPIFSLSTIQNSIANAGLDLTLVQPILALIA